MAGFNKFILTDLGTALLNRVIAEQKTLKFTKFEIGSGKQIDIKTSTQLIDKFHEFSVNETNVLVGGYTNIKGFFDNKNLTSEKLMSEIGVYAQIDDEVLTEILFSYSTSVGDGENIPNPAVVYFSRTLSVVNRTDDVASVTFNVTIDKNRYDFNTLAELQAATWLDVGDKVNLWGTTVLGDAKKSSKIITSENTGIALNNGLFAKKHSDFIQDGGIIATGLDYRNDDNAIWGGEYGGYIQDASVTKVVGKRYIDQFDGKAYECLKPSHENTITNYQACNVKDNLSKLNNLDAVIVSKKVLGRVAVTFFKMMNVVVAHISHQGGVEPITSEDGFIDKDFRPKTDIYISLPCEKGSPFIFLTASGKMEVATNMATFQPPTTETTYFLSQSYITNV